jgi:hypothetical protein
MPVISAIRRLRQENGEFETSLVYILRLCPEITTKRYFSFF